MAAARIRRVRKMPSVPPTDTPVFAETVAATGISPRELYASAEATEQHNTQKDDHD